MARPSTWYTSPENGLQSIFSGLISDFVLVPSLFSGDLMIPVHRGTKCNSSSQIFLNRQFEKMNNCSLHRPKSVSVPKSGMTADTDGITDLGGDILVHLYLSGCDVPANIAEHWDRSRPAVSRRLSELSDRGLVKSKGRGVWKLTPAGATYARTLTSHITAQQMRQLTLTESFARADPDRDPDRDPESED
jgi:DNA-binding MarR family transcriptional regulator